MHIVATCDYTIAIAPSNVFLYHFRHSVYSDWNYIIGEHCVRSSNERKLCEWKKKKKKLVFQSKTRTQLVSKKWRKPPSDTLEFLYSMQAQTNTHTQMTRCEGNWCSQLQTNEQMKERKCFFHHLRHEFNDWFFISKPSGRRPYTRTHRRAQWQFAYGGKRCTRRIYMYILRMQKYINFRVKKETLLSDYFYILTNVCARRTLNTRSQTGGEEGKRIFVEKKIVSWNRVIPLLSGSPRFIFFEFCDRNMTTFE